MCDLLLADWTCPDLPMQEPGWFSDTFCAFVRWRDERFVANYRAALALSATKFLHITQIYKRRSAEKLALFALLVRGGAAMVGPINLHNSAMNARAGLASARACHASPRCNRNLPPVIPLGRCRAGRLVAVCPFPIARLSKDSV